MICKKCSTDNPPEKNLCQNCGAPLHHSKRGGFFKKFGGIVGVVAVAAIAFTVNVGMFQAKYEQPIDKTKYPIAYVKNNSLYLKSLSKKKVTNLSDFLLSNSETTEAPKIFLSKNGNGLYFLENYDETTNSGSFFASFNGKTKVSISSKAYANIQISQNGTHALFIDAPDANASSGALNLYTKNEKKEKLVDRASLTEFQFSPNGKAFAYIELLNDSLKGELYFQKIGGEREKVDSDVSKIVYLPNNSGALYLKQTNETFYDLYYWHQGKASKKIAGNVTGNMIYTTPFSNKTLFCADNASPFNYTLYASGKNAEASIIDTQVMMPLQYDAQYQNVIYTKNFSQSEFTSDTYIKRKGKDPMKLLSATDTNATSVQASQDFSKVAYIGEIDPGTGLGKLYLQEFGFFSSKAPTLIAENVSSFSLSRSGRILAYTASTSENPSSKNLYLYAKKKQTLVAEHIQDGNYMLSDNAQALYYIANYNEEEDSGNLFVKNALKPSSEPTKINSDVSRMFYPRSHKQAIYLKNTDSKENPHELYFWKGKSKSELIDTGDIQVLFN